MPKALRGPLLALLGVALGAVPGGDVTAPSSGVDATRIPATARQYLPLVTDLTAQQCPELPPLWVVAQVEAESGWDPAVARRRCRRAAAVRPVHLDGGRRHTVVGPDPPAR